MKFEFTTASRIIFGCGSISRVPDILKDSGRHIFMVTGKDPDRAGPLTDNLPKNEFDIVTFRISSEPATDAITEGVELARKEGSEVVVGIGGGSVIDSAKAIAALVPNRGDLMDYLEVIGIGKKLESNPLPFIAIPTTAGTGAEVTKNSVIKSPEHNVKVSLRSPLMFPDVAVVDPELTISMPPDITAATGMDALTHLLETFVSGQSNPFIDNLCREGIKRIAKSLGRAFNDGTDIEAREDMAFASMLGGMALANVKLGAVHGFAGPLGGMFSVPHGVICASLLPAVIRVNLNAVLLRSDEYYISKYNEVAQILTGNSDAVAVDGILWAERMVDRFKIPSLSDLGVLDADFPVLVEKAKNASSMKGNPVVLGDDELMEILGRSS